MATRTSRVTFTYEDYLLFPADGNRHEIIEGEHYVTPAPKTRHQQISGNLFRILDTHALQTRAGQVFATPTDVILAEHEIVQPDILFISTGRTSIITEDNVKGAPDLVVEILSEGFRKNDEVVKRKLYERFGVKEYWIVDPALELVKVLRLGADRYAAPIELTLERGESITTHLLSGLTIPLAAVFERR